MASSKTKSGQSNALHGPSTKSENRNSVEASSSGGEKKCGNMAQRKNGSKSVPTKSTSTNTPKQTRSARNNADHSKSEEPDPIMEELADLIKLMTITPKSGIGGIPDNVLYYGWFFAPSISSSLKLMADHFLVNCYLNSKHFQRFMKSISAKASIPDPLSYYTRPSSSSSAKSAIYHVTAKFCARAPCFPYAKLVNPCIGREFDLRIIGIFFTESTYGYRLKLSKRQQELFDSERDFVPEQSRGTTKSSLQTRSQTRLQKNTVTPLPEEIIESDYYGISKKRQPKDFKPSISRAHVTLGCGPGVKAMQTGLDLLDVISLENQRNCNTASDTEIEGGTLRQYGRGNGDAFVMYFNFEYIAKAVFMSVP